VVRDFAFFWCSYTFLTIQMTNIEIMNHNAIPSFLPACLPIPLSLSDHRSRACVRSDQTVPCVEKERRRLFPSTHCNHSREDARAGSGSRKNGRGLKMLFDYIMTSCRSGQKETPKTQHNTRKEKTRLNLFFLDGLFAHLLFSFFIATGNR
jgi:hypothetical protein